MKRLLTALTAGLILLAGAQAKGETMTNVHSFTLKNIEGQDVSLGSYTGKVLLVVNVASKCGFTSQYAGLETLYKEFAPRGFLVLGFPANNFLGQEPGTDEQIKQFCTLTYGVTFPMFAKISVKGDDMHPLYKYLTDKSTNPDFPGAIAWNFNKFLIGKDGRILNRFGSRTKPDDPALRKAIEDALAR
jgi:glutathione peroxidase